jgi:hypothetical protein
VSEREREREKQEGGVGEGARKREKKTEIGEEVWLQMRPVVHRV